MTNSTIDRIRPFMDSEVSEAISLLMADREFQQILGLAFGAERAKKLLSGLPRIETVRQFKEEFSAPLLHNLVVQTAFSCDMTGKSMLGGDRPATFISNHRDIILDSALLNLMLWNEGYRLPRIAIGDNLMVRHWVRTLVRLNDSVLVERSLPPRAFLESATALSQFLNKTINEDGQSLWIAQREGRAKTSDDRTQPALLRMLTLGGEGKTSERLAQLNVVPLAISYEYDPCDYLKAREMWLRETRSDWRKGPQDDAESMKKGLLGQKGRIHLSIGNPLNSFLEHADLAEQDKQLFEQVAAYIDTEIFLHYRFYPGNYIAHDLLYHRNPGWADEGYYTEQDKETFLHYLNTRLQLAMERLAEDGEPTGTEGGSSPDVSREPSNGVGIDRSCETAISSEERRNEIRLFLERQLMLQYATPLENYCKARDNDVPLRE